MANPQPFPRRTASPSGSKPELIEAVSFETLLYIKSNADCCRGETCVNTLSKDVFPPCSSNVLSLPHSYVTSGFWNEHKT